MSLLSDSDAHSLISEIEDHSPIRRSHGKDNPSSPPENNKSSLPTDETDTPNVTPSSEPSYPDKNRGTPAHTDTPRPQLHPAERFRSSVRRIIAAHRSSRTFASRHGVSAIGAEPGINPRHASAEIHYGHIRTPCTIEIADYACARSSFVRMGNRQLKRFLSDLVASKPEPWVKVRWINVGGISWDVVSALALKYEMHPLALEDVLHDRGHARSKADYYSQHLFLRLLCHTLTDDSVDDEAIATTDPRSESPLPLEFATDDDTDSDDYELSDSSRTGAYGRASGMRFSMGHSMGVLRRPFMKDAESGPEPRAPQDSGVNALHSTKSFDTKVLRELKKGDRIGVNVAPMCIFLYRDGTVISIHTDQKLAFTAPIKERLQRPDTGLRMSADPSLLVQSLLDVVVDQALAVTEAYQVKILKIERQVLLKPNVQTVRRLHILQGDLTLHKRTLEPIKTVIYGLRRYDVDRVAALSEYLDPDARVEGYMSHKSKIYLEDVHDHMEYVLTSMDMFAGVCENLINYTFNMASYEMNEVMRRLTLATIIFLPLTLLTGYFGMNFDRMWSVQHGHSDIIFWEIAIPVMVVLLPVFMWRDLQNFAHYLQKRIMHHNVEKRYKRA